MLDNWLKVHHSVTICTNHHYPMKELAALGKILVLKNKTMDFYPISPQMFRVSCSTNDGGKKICPISREELLEAMRAIHDFYAERQRRFREQHVQNRGALPPPPF